ncbi:MAG: S-methyl-5-thioribose-1-phosphate isomerase [Pseudomonadota bacterium]
MNSAAANDSVRALEWRDGTLRVLDQRKLPEIIEYANYRTARGVAEAIASMRVRGAPAIGIAAAYGVVLAAIEHYQNNPGNWKKAIEQDFEVLSASRPTAVNLFWALELMRARVAEAEEDPVPSLLRLAQKVHEDDITANRAMGERGAALLQGAAGALTHCNTGSLATGGYGTALGVIRSAYRDGLKTIYATETRPWLQGARLTLWELQQDNIPATLIADSAAGFLMRTGAVQWVVVGADRIAANGDLANKIGTYSLAVLARHHGVKFMVVSPTSTIDWKIADGRDIVIENRDKGELLRSCYLTGHTQIDAWNPVFDVTPANLINVIVTENGIVTTPDLDRMKILHQHPTHSTKI